MNESIRELRRICQDSREADGTYKIRWVEKYLLRSVSIYFTRLCLKTGISANQATFIDFLIGVAAGIFFLFPEPNYWIIGSLLMYLVRVFDAVDGELSRYNKSASLRGQHYDSMNDIFLQSYLPICMSFGIYSIFHNVAAFIFGFVAAISPCSIYLGPAVLAHLVPSRNSPSVRVTSGKIEHLTKKQKSFFVISLGVKLGHLVFGENSFYYTVLAVSIADCFVSPFAIGSIMANVRYLCFIAYAIGVFSFALHTIYTTYRRG